MTHALRMSLAFLTSAVLLSGCAHDDPQRMMNERAEYEDEAPETSDLNLSVSGALGEPGKLPPRPEPRIANVWVHPQRISEREHFWGAWVSLRLEDDQWNAASAKAMEPAEPQKAARTKMRPLAPKKKP